MKDWIVSSLDKASALNASEKLNITPFLAVLLNIRGVKEENDIAGFLNGYNNFSDPYDFIDMDKLIERLKRAINDFEKICIYGDYDADGVTAAAIMYLHLKAMGANVMYYIPKRDEDGYGLNNNAIDYLKECGVEVILTVDNGISAEKEVAYAHELGIDAIITDHHRPPDKIPDAEAVVDPYREDCKSKFKNFSGVGVAFKVIEALEYGKKGLDELISLYGDLVTIGTIGDSIELLGETRDFIRKGLHIISNSKRPAIKVMLETAGLNKESLDAIDIAFNVVPKINASGRMGSAGTAIKFLLSESESEAEEVYREINNENDMRRSIENKIMKCIEQKLKEEPERLLSKIIICEGRGWHEGVLGIIASRVTEKYGKPSIIISYDDENAKGSGRSIDGFSLHSAVSACSEHLERFGGHPMAAGINLKTCNINKFKESILRYADTFEEMPFQKLLIDFKISPCSLSEDILDELQKLKPFGNGNAEPVFGLYRMKIDSIGEVGGGRHLRLTVSRDGKKITVMYFRKSKGSFFYKVGDFVDLAVTLHKNSYAGFDRLSLFLKDIKPAGLDTHKCIKEKRIYEKFLRKEKLTRDEAFLLYPRREEFALVYRYLKNSGKKCYVPEIAVNEINNEMLNTAKLRVIFDVMEELNLISFSLNQDEYRIIINNVSKKVNLDDSKILLGINKNK